MKIRFCNYHKVEHIVDKDYDPSQCFYDDATDPTDSQSIERTPDPSESKLDIQEPTSDNPSPSRGLKAFLDPTTQTTKLESETVRSTFAELHYHNYHENGTEMQWEAWLLKAEEKITALIQSEASRIAETEKNRYCGICFKPSLERGGWYCEEHGNKSVLITAKEASEYIKTDVRRIALEAMNAATVERRFNPLTSEAIDLVSKAEFLKALTAPEGGK